MTLKAQQDYGKVEVRKMKSKLASNRTCSSFYLRFLRRRGGRKRCLSCTSTNWSLEWSCVVLSDEFPCLQESPISWPYFQFESNGGPLVRCAVKWSRVQHENWRARWDTRNDAKMTCIWCKTRSLKLWKTPWFYLNEPNWVPTTYPEPKVQTKS